MTGSPFQFLRDACLACRDRLTWWWYTRERDGAGFVAMLTLPLAALGTLVYFSHGHGLRIQALHEREERERARAAELQCLAENIYFEARGEPLAGMYAVAEVTVNRVASRHFPDTICEVVHEQRWDPVRKRLVGMFSWTEFEYLERPRGETWRQAQEVATRVYDQMYTPVVPGALFYHATYIEPRWARGKRRVATIGNHVFYR